MSLSAAFLEQLRAEPRLTVHSGGVPQRTPPPYVSVHISDGLPIRSRLARGSRHRVVYAYTHSVGATDTASRAVAQLVERRLLDVVLEVPGWECASIEQTEARPTDPDESTGITVLDTVAVWRLEADRTDEQEQP